MPDPGGPEAPRDPQPPGEPDHTPGPPATTQAQPDQSRPATAAPGPPAAVPPAPPAPATRPPGRSDAAAYPPTPGPPTAGPPFPPQPSAPPTAQRPPRPVGRPADPVAGLAADLLAHGATATSTPRTARSGRGLARLVTAALCAVLGVGLLVGAVLGSLLREGGGPARSTDAFQHARTLWRGVPVDTLFPRTLTGRGAGPGGADRTWTRIAVAPDDRCAGAFDPLLATALSPVGCARLLRATYADATSTSVTTVGLVVTRADAAGMRALRNRFATERLDQRADLLPKPYPADGTAAEGFGDAQRASWRVSVPADLPLVVYAVSGFADGRDIQRPEPADRATARGATTDPAEAGLGHDAKGLATGVERAFRTALNAAMEAR
ncbi:hypothetical protein OYE22_04515 [Streptomyces sp. 71268]|uniref:hypothetical protein n=1 Tax=Streptomyces sp. 71268 TaxID=3002640 RepID=UPI0023F7D322|nr:hypothetical protein [Streptomyces sp. 71268]WEV24549.1 hypothetical protein OYE22_04515 [Streptomyces sp. 71268]